MDRGLIIINHEYSEFVQSRVSLNSKYIIEKDFFSGARYATAIIGS